MVTFPPTVIRIQNAQFALRGTKRKTVPTRPRTFVQNAPTLAKITEPLTLNALTLNTSKPNPRSRDPCREQTNTDFCCILSNFPPLTHQQYSRRPTHRSGPTIYSESSNDQEQAKTKEPTLSHC